MSTYNKNMNETDWAERMQALLEEAQNRAPFAYDPESDMLYQQYRDQYQKLGRRAMEDTMGQAAGLTGGYGNTYGEIAGMEAYETYLGKLNNILPELYDRSAAAYEQQTEAIYDSLSFAAEQKQAAFEQCMTLLENGLQPSVETLKAAGLYSDASDSSQTGDSGSQGSSQGGSQGSNQGGSAYSGYDNGNLTTEQIKELQAWLGVAVDGEYGPKTQAAAEAIFGGTNMSAIQAWIAYQKAIGAFGGGTGSAGNDLQN